MFRGEKIKTYRGLLKLLLCIAVLLCLLLPESLKASAKSQFEINASVGYGGKLRIYSDVPVTVEITNNGSNFEGRVQVIVSNRNGGNYMYEKDISIPASGKKTVSITIPVETYITAVNVRVVTAKEKVLQTRTVPVSTPNVLDSINIGVLSDDWSALSYVHGIDLYSLSNYYSYNKNASSYFFGMTADTFPEDAEALELMDIILISNFSTDTLTSGQLDALEQWVKNGGILLVGTGSTYSKVFSGLKNLTLFKNVNTSKISYKTISTTYGLNTAIAGYISCSDVTGLVNKNDEFSYYPIAFQTRYYEIVNEFFNKIDTSKEYDPEVLYTEFYNTYISDFRTYLGNYYGYNFYTEQEWIDYGDSNIFRWSYDALYSIFNAEYLAQSNTETTTDTVTPVTAEFTIVDVTSSLTLYADNTNGGDGAIMSQQYRFGSGLVIIAGMDFTQNPLASYKEKAKVLTYIIKANADSELRQKIATYINKVNNSSWGNYDNEERSTYNYLFDALSSASMPPVATYFIILVAYLVCIFLLFVRLKKKKKNIYYWVGQAALALAFSLLIYIIGISTRLYSAEVRTGRFRELTSYGELVTDASVAVLPSKKKYQISFNANKDYHVVPEYTYYYNSGTSTNLDSYSLGMNRKPDSKVFTLNNTVPLSTSDFLGSASDVSHGSLEAKIILDSFDLFSSGSVTNNYETDLTNVFVYYNNNLYMLGDIKAGETVIMDANTPSATTGHYYYTGSDVRKITQYFHGNNSYVDFMSLFIGKSSEEYILGNTRYALYSVLSEKLIDNQDSGITVGGFTSVTLDDVPVLSGAKSKIITLVYKQLSSDDSVSYTN